LASNTEYKLVRDRQKLPEFQRNVMKKLPTVDVLLQLAKRKPGKIYDCFFWGTPTTPRA